VTTPHCLAPAVDANALGTAKIAKDAKREKAYWRRNGFSRFFASYGEARSMPNDLGLNPTRARRVEDELRDGECRDTVMDGNRTSGSAKEPSGG
jgi:hypothetical protein